MQIDHVLIATADLDVAVARLRETHGLTPSGGGRHAGIGTENRIVALGRGYLELISVVDPAEALSSPLGAAFAARIARRGEGLMGWAVAVEDVAAEAERTGSELSAIERAGLKATLAGVSVAMADQYLPFFIQRDPGSADPGAEGDAGGITSIELTGDPARLAAWLGDNDLPVRISAGKPAVVRVGIGAGGYP